MILTGQGKAWHGMAWLGMARLGGAWALMAHTGKDTNLILAGHGWARLGKARLGVAGRGAARRGEARQGRLWRITERKVV